MLIPVDDLVRTAMERIAERDGLQAAERAGEKLRALLALKRPRTIGEALALVEAHLRTEIGRAPPHK